VRSADEGLRVIPNIVSFDENRRLFLSVIERGEASDGEIDWYEFFSEPELLYVNRVQLSRNGQYLRRLRRIRSRRSHR
jgi:hypothetical protein